MATYRVTCTKDTNSDGTPYSLTINADSESQALARIGGYCEANHLVERITDA